MATDRHLVNFEKKAINEKLLDFYSESYIKDLGCVKASDIKWFCVEKIEEGELSQEEVRIYEEIIRRVDIFF